MGATTKREPQTRQEQAEYVVDRLTVFGVRINPTSRIGRMLRILRRPGIIEPDDPDYPIVLESIRDMYQLRLIVDTMDTHREDSEFRRAVNTLKKDATLPDEGNPGGETRGRTFDGNAGRHPPQRPPAGTPPPPCPTGSSWAARTASFPRTF